MELYILINKKAQTWFFDFVIGLILFSSSLILFYGYYHNFLSEGDITSNDLLNDAKTISSSLVSSGYPFGWSNETVEKIGLTSNNQRINETKISLLMNLSYNKTRNMFGTRFDYWLFFEDRNHSIIPIEDEEGYGIKPFNHKELVKVTRIVVKDSDIVRMVVYVWQ